MRNKIKFIALIIGYIIILSYILQAETSYTRYPQDQFQLPIVIGDTQLPGISIIKEDNVMEETPTIEEGKVKIIIKLKHPPLAIDPSESNQQALIQEQNYVENILEKDFEAKITAKWSLIYNGFAAEIDSKYWNEIEKIPHIKKISKDIPVYAMLQDSVPLINAPQVWQQIDSSGNYITGLNIKVAVIDTGVAYTHPDLGGCLGTSCKVIGGYDFVNSDSDPMDDHGHGTHVAGIIAANGGIKGVAPDAKILAYKTLDASGSGSSSWIISAINQAVLDGAQIISISLGAFGYSDDDLSEAADNAMIAGTVVVVAAGNAGPTATQVVCRHNFFFYNQPLGFFSICSPGNSLEAITVGASTKSDVLAGFSGRGYALFSNGSISGIKPDILAPGVSINSTVPTGSCTICDPSGYKSISGTSMATPHIAGVAALLKQAHPSWTSQEIKLAMNNPPADLAYQPIEQGSGRVDAYASYIIKTLLSPNNKFLGLNLLPDTAIFQISELFELKNIHTLPQSYSLSTTTNYPGVVSLNPSTVALNPGQSTPINLSYSFNNSLDIGAVFYNGKILIPAQNINVPFSMFKMNLTGQAALTLNFGPYHYYTYIFNLLPNSHPASPTGYGNVIASIYTDPPSSLASNITIFLPENITYYLSSTFAKPPAWYLVPSSYWGDPYTTIFTNFYLTNLIPTTTITKEQANSVLDFTILDKNGTPIFPNEYCYYNWNTICNRGNTFMYFTLNESVGIGVGQLGFESALLHFYNDVPLWALLSVHTFSTPEPATYIARNFIKPAVGNHSVIIQPSTKISMKYKFIPSFPTLTSLFFQNFYHFNDTIYYSVLDIGLHRRVIFDTGGKDYEIFYLTPDSYLAPGTDFEKVVDKLSRIEMFNDYTFGGPTQVKLQQTPYFKIPQPDTFEHLLVDTPWVSLNILNTTYNTIYETEISPNVWQGKMSNSVGTVKLRVYRGIPGVPILSSLPLIKQNNIFQHYGITNPTAIAYTLILSATGGISSSGTLSAPPAPPYPILDLNVAPGAYMLILVQNGYDWIDGTPANLLINLNFDTTQSDNNPPVIDFFRILADNLYTGNVLPVSSNNKVIFKAKDLESSISNQKIYYKLSGTGIWIELPVISGTNYDYVTLPNLPTGNYDLRYFIVDSFSNSLDQIQIPGFKISSSASPPNLNQTIPVVCGNYICDTGETAASCPTDCGTPIISSMPSTANIGTPVIINLISPGDAGEPYVLALSLGNSGVPLPTFGGPTLIIPLSPDGVFWSSLSSPYLGLLNSISTLYATGTSGTNTVVLPIPNIPILHGFTVYVAYAILHPSGTSVTKVSPSYNFMIN